MQPVEKRRQFERDALPHLDSLFEVALRLAQGDDAQAKDFLQEALLQAYRSWHTFRPGTNCRAWLMAILRNTMVNHHRANRRSVPQVEYSAVSERQRFRDAGSAPPDGRFFDRIMDHEVVRAIDRLPLPYREVLILSDLEGMSYAEIVEVLDVPVGTVKSRLFRARKTLQEELYEYAVACGFLKDRRSTANGNGREHGSGPDADRNGGGDGRAAPRSGNGYRDGDGRRRNGDRHETGVPSNGTRHLDAVAAHGIGRSNGDAHRNGATSNGHHRNGSADRTDGVTRLNGHRIRPA